MKSESARPFGAVQWPAWLAGLLALLGLVVFLAQALYFAHTTISSLDEGAYLYKGYLFASGQYEPFQPYGPQTNKAPLAFLIPGYAQVLFGPGLRTGRYLAVGFAVLMVIATWITARRFSGWWIAAAAVWVFALNPAQIRIYSEAVTQSEVACLLAWILALSLGKQRPAWQVVLAGALTGLMIMIRQNMVIVLPALGLYLWWRQGWKMALAGMLSGAAVLILFHALYWPYIMQVWTPWLPGPVRAWFAGSSIPISIPSNWNPSMDMTSRVLSFFQGIRLHFVAMAGFLFGLLLWPKREPGREQNLGEAVFLAALFMALLLMHTWASISNDYCVFCFTPYLSFFSVTAILFTSLLLRQVRVHPKPLQQILLVLAVLPIFSGMGYSASEETGNWLLGISVPRMREGRILPGFTTLWELLSNKFALERNLAEKLVSAAGGLIIGILILLLAYLIYRAVQKSGRGYANVLAMLVLALGLLLAPVLAGNAGRPECPQMDVIRANEQAGNYLAEQIQPGKSTYWNGGLSVAPLLYAPEVHIYLPQINDGYAYLVGGEGQVLLKYGFWNEQLDKTWLQQADYIIVEGWRYGNMKEELPASKFDEFPRSPTQTSCKDGSGLRVFQRK